MSDRAQKSRGSKFRGPIYYSKISERFKNGLESFRADQFDDDQRWCVKVKRS